MPFGDGTGPMGLGPMTGRRARFCAGLGVPGMRRGFSRSERFPGFCGRGQGYGRMANGYGIDFETESDILRRRERGLSEALETVKKRLEELSASSDGAV